MEDKEFFGATEGKPLFTARQDSRTSPMKINVPVAGVGDEVLINGFVNPARLRGTDPLRRVTDPELRKIMETVLDEDADLIAYLRDR